LEIYCNIKFYENLSSGSRVVSCGLTERHVNYNNDSYDLEYMEFQQVLFVDYNSHLEEVEKASLDRRDTE
jgi:hypothetical protein